MSEILKRCTRCEKEKALHDFYPNKDGKHGRRGKCKSCHNERFRHHSKKRNQLKKKLPNTLTSKEKYLILVEHANSKCMLSGTSEAVVLDHFVPINLGEIVVEYGIGGTTYENMLPLSASLNKSKSADNPFVWFETASIKHNLDLNAWDKAIKYMAVKNKMTKWEYRNCVEQCFMHARIIRWVEDLDDSVNERHGRPTAILGRGIRMGINMEEAVSRYGTESSKEYIKKQQEYIRKLKKIEKIF
ncbi:hypothetical protein M3221_11975 [Domibacillus indicus]|uniref:hypothetical protein n=1 Tax=Domibacillus indicus TaxID=1437523 RepID=UPI002041C918|nr:hypothetical protein [Domibacillus indicus]MCM3789123.1 hypothetical protein [Domibacillus indicus]